MQYQFKIVKQENVYRGFFKVTRFHVDYERFQGGMFHAVMRECATSNGFTVIALPYDPDNQCFILIEQFRIGAMAAGENPWQLEPVAGFMDKQHETPEQCVQRELQEEIGTAAQHLTYIQHYLSSPGGSSGQTHLFFAQVNSGDCATYTGLEEECEDIRVHLIPFAQAYRQLLNGAVTNTTLLLTLHAFFLRYPQYIPQNHDNPVGDL